MERLRVAGFTPPSTTELGLEGSILKALESSGDLVRIGDFHLTGSQIADLKNTVRPLLVGDGATVAEIRDALGTTRKYAVPLCEWMDQAGITRRRGDLRIAGVNL